MIVEFAPALARLAVRVGANPAPGQTVVLDAKLGQESMAREVAAAAYDAGAHEVEGHYVDPTSSSPGSSKPRMRRWAP